MSPAALPVLYSFRRCPYAIRARLALVISGQVCELREVVLKNKPPSLLQTSPQGTVPVLVLPPGPDGAPGRVLEHSLDIMLWALQRRDPDRWLAPSQGALQDMLALIAQCDGTFKQALDRCKYPNRYPDAAPSLARAQAVAWLQLLEEQLTGQPFLFGTHTALADMAIAPFVRQFAGIDANWWRRQPWPHLQAWLAQWQASALLASVMHKLPAWAEGTKGVLLPHPQGA